MRYLLAGVLMCAAVSNADAYLVGPGHTFAELEQTADVVVKATVTADRVITDPAFPPVTGYATHATTLRVISMIKGAAVTELEFRHYAETGGPGGMSGYTPPHWELPIGKSYLVLGVRAADGTVHPMASYAEQDPSPGVIAVSNDRPVRGKSTHDIAWAELTASLTAPSPADVLAAIALLDRHSGGHHTPLPDFERAPVLAALRPLIRAADPTIADAAIGVFGEDSPYYDDEQAVYWLAGLGAGTIPGIGELTVSPHPSAETARTELLAVAQGQGPVRLRAHAIRALGAVPMECKECQSDGWGTDPAPEIRAAAARIDEADLARAAVDPAPEVRRAVAIAIGQHQRVAQLSILDTMLTDRDRKVREYAAQSLLAFKPAIAAPVMTKNLTSQYRALFVNALARGNAAPYLAELDEVVSKHLEPTDWSGGMIPAYDAWAQLFDYLKTLSPVELARHTRELDALERMQWTGSSEPVKLYVLYKVRGMAPRAAKFRAMYTKTRADEDQFFANADKAPLDLANY